jgi:hypothetical protein
VVLVALVGAEMLVVLVADEVAVVGVVGSAMSQR